MVMCLPTQLFWGMGIKAGIHRPNLLEAFKDQRSPTYSNPLMLLRQNEEIRNLEIKIFQRKKEFLKVFLLEW